MAGLNQATDQWPSSPASRSRVIATLISKGTATIRSVCFKGASLWLSVPKLRRVAVMSSRRPKRDSPSVAALTPRPRHSERSSDPRVT